jgi:uncharacterized protein YjiS (DUF1127 family)
MTHPFSATLKTNHGHGPLAGLFGRVAHLLEAWHETRARAAAMDELARLSDTELSDIGLCRGDIPHLFRGGLRTEH